MRLGNPVLTPNYVVSGTFPAPKSCKYIFSHRFWFTSKRLYGASKTISNNG